MLHIPEVDAYLEYAKQHPDWINRKRWLLFENVVKPTLSDPEVVFDEARYRKCLKYVETYYYPLFPWEKFFAAFVFMYKNGLPLFRTMIDIMGRGNGKNGFIVPIVNFFQTPAMGLKEYNIEIVANSEDQAEQSFGIIAKVMKDGKKMKKRFDGKWLVNSERCICLPTGSVLKFNTSNASTKDGKATGCVVFDEIHEYKTHRLMDVFIGGLGKGTTGEPRIFITTTNGFERDGVFDDYLRICDRVLQTGENTTRVFPFVCMVDREEEIDDPSKWYKANPSLEYLPILMDEIRTEWEEAKLMPEKRPAFVAKRMNWVAEPEEARLVAWEYIKATGAPLMVFPERRLAILGLDFQLTTDMLGASLVYADDERNRFSCLNHGWMTNKSADFTRAQSKAPLEHWQDIGLLDILKTPQIDLNLVLNWAFSQDFEILMSVCDTYRAQVVKDAFLARGIDVYDKKQFWLVRPSDIMLNLPVIQRYLIDGAVTCGDDPLWRWSAWNTKLKPAPHGNFVLTKVEGKSLKNDVFMAWFAAMCKVDALPVLNYQLPAEMFDTMTY